MSHEIEVKAISGWLMLVVFIALLLIAIPFFAGGVIGIGVVILVLAMLIPNGFVVIEPNGSSVLLLAGSYRGTIKDSGFKWVNPFYSKRAITLRVKSLNGDKLKVNDLAGNPVMRSARRPWFPTCSSCCAATMRLSPC